MDVGQGTGNGFLFKNFDPNGLSWAIDQAMGFFNLPAHVKAKEITRVMGQSKAAFNHSVTARRYMDLYEKMLERPLINE
jgi:starch synthase/alpha-amylase